MLKRHISKIWAMKCLKQRKKDFFKKDERRKSMNKKAKKFCYEYVIDLNATQAAIRAGYSERSAYSTGSRLLRNAEVQELIKELQSNLKKAAGVTALKVVQEHKKIAFSSIAHLHNTWIELKDFEALTEEEKACIKSVSTKVVKRNIGTKERPDIVDIEYVRIELYDKQKALDSIANLLGLNAPKEINQKVDIGKLSDEQVDQIINELNAE
jgi:phage terminase small subunit